MDAAVPPYGFSGVAKLHGSASDILQPPGAKRAAFGPGRQWKCIAGFPRKTLSPIIIRSISSRYSEFSEKKKTAYVRSSTARQSRHMPTVVLSQCLDVTCTYMVTRTPSAPASRQKQSPGMALVHTMTTNSLPSLPCTANGRRPYQ